MRGQPGCLLQSAGGEANRILLASVLSSMHIICPNRVSQRDWIIAVSLGVSLRTSSFRWNFEIKKSWIYMLLCFAGSVQQSLWQSHSVFMMSAPLFVPWQHGTVHRTGAFIPGQHGESIPLHTCTCRGIRWLQLVFSSLVCVYVFHILRAWFLSESFICTRMEQNFVRRTFVF